jgi:hypothetical protein
MKLHDAFGGDFLKALDLGGIDGQDAKVRISAVKLWRGDDGKNKIIVSFAGKKKSLLCNKTNAKTIARAYGDETDNWIGQPVILFVTMVDFRGDQVEAIRVRIPTQTAAQRTQQPIAVGSPSVAVPRIPARPTHSVPATDGEYTEINPPPHPGPSANSLDDEIPF